VGLAPGPLENGIAILHYTDDTVLCNTHDLEKAINLKPLLYMFELMCGLKINFEKSGVITIEGDNDITMLYADMFNCHVGKLPMKYICVHVSFAALKISNGIS
jgi:hypothetical protein